MNSGWGPPANSCCCTDTGRKIPTCGRRSMVRSRDEGRRRRRIEEEEEQDTGGGTETAQRRSTMQQWHPPSPPHCHRCVLCSDHLSDGGECWIVSTTRMPINSQKINADVMRRHLAQAFGRLEDCKMSQTKQPLISMKLKIKTR